MSKSSVTGIEPARAIADLAQSDLSVDDFSEQVLAVFDRELGFDTAFAIRSTADAPMISRHADNTLVKIAKRAFRLASTRYKADILPAFASSERKGGCIDSEFWPAGYKRESLFYREVLLPSGTHSMLQLCARWRGRPLLRMNLNRHGRKPFRRRDLDRALRILPTLEACLGALVATEGPEELRGLTKREIEVAQLVAQGLTSAEIGSVLGTSGFTVRNQLSKIYEKLNLDSRAELAALVARTSASTLTG